VRFPIRHRINKDGEVADEFVAPAGRARDVEVPGGGLAGLHARRIGPHGAGPSGQVLDGEGHRARLAAAVGDAVAELVVDAAIGADAVERGAHRRNLYQHGAPHAERHKKARGVKQQHHQHHHAFAVAQAHAPVPGARTGVAQQFALFAPGIVDQVGLVEVRHDLLEGIDALRAVDALDLEGRLADVDVHGTYAHALLAIDALVHLVAVMDQQRVEVAQQALQVAVGADRGTEALAYQGEIDEGYQRDGGAGDARRRVDIERGEPAPEVARFHEVADEDERQQDAGRRQHRVEHAAPHTFPRRRLPSWELLRDLFAQPLFQHYRGLAEDHLRARVSAKEAPIEDPRRHHQEHEEHHGEKDDGELIDPQFIAGEVEALFGNVEAHHVEEGQRQEYQEA